jgi:hypothetical protein
VASLLTPEQRARYVQQLQEDAVLGPLIHLVARALGLV